MKYTDEQRNQIKQISDLLLTTFSWNQTPQGFNYWNIVHMNLEDLLKEEKETPPLKYDGSERWETPQTTCEDILEDTLNERGSRYGVFKGIGEISQEFKSVLHSYVDTSKLQPYQIEALEMILHKMARILNGDPTYVDNFRDIAGYATLVERTLNGEEI